MSGLAELQRAFTRVCFDATPREEDLALLHADRERWLMYRGMVRHRLVGMMRMGLPKSAALLGSAFDDAAARYLAEHGPRSRYIRDVVHELAAHMLPAIEADPSAAPHTVDLIRYEAAKWRVASLEWSVEPHDEFDFEAAPLFNPTMCVVELRHRVDIDERPPTLDEVHHAVVYRKPESAKIYTYVLNPIGGRLLRAWREGRPCAEGARAVLAELGRAPDPRFVDGMAGVLAALIEEQIILGSRR